MRQTLTLDYNSVLLCGVGWQEIINGSEAVVEGPGHFGGVGSVCRVTLYSSTIHFDINVTI